MSEPDVISWRIRRRFVYDKESGLTLMVNEYEIEDDVTGEPIFDQDEGVTE